MERNHIGIGREPPRLSVTLPLSFRGAFGEQIFPGDDGMPNSRLRLSMRRRRSKRGGLAPVMTASGRRDVICIEIRFVFLPPLPSRFSLVAGVTVKPVYHVGHT